MAKATGKTPDALQRKPEYPYEHGEYLQAFELVSRGRRIGLNSVGYIPLAEIEAYCRLFEVFDVELFVRVMVELDGIFISFIDSKKESGNG